MDESAHLMKAVAWRKVASIVATALVVKLVVLAQLWDHPLLQPHGELDTAYYIALGRRLAEEGVFAPIGAFFVSPLYVYFLASVFAVGGSPLSAQLIQVVLGAAAVGLTFVTALHWFGERAALVAAALAILAGTFTFNEVLVLQSALDPFLVSCALYALTRATASSGTGSFAAAGVWLGLLALNRPNALLFAAAAAAAVLVIEWRRRSPNRKEVGRLPVWARVERAAVLLATLLAVLAANAARNYVVSGEAVLIASHGGLNFYIGNHDRADGTYTPVPGITPSIAGQDGDSIRVAESDVGRPLSAEEVSGYFTRRALEWIQEHPIDALRLTLRKIAILLNHVDVPLNYSYAFYAREPSSFLRVLAVGPWLLLPFGLVGLLWPALRANRAGYWVWGMFVPVYGAAVVVFFVTDRYRLPIFVPLCAAAGAALVGLFDVARARKIRTLLTAGAALAIAAAVAFANLGLDNGLGGEQTRKAVLFVEQGAFDEALAYVERVSREHRHPGVLRYRVGQALLHAGRYGDAVSLLSQALAIDGPRPAIRLALGEALLRAGRSTEAVSHLEAAYDADYDNIVAGPLLVRALVLAGRPEHAVQRLAGMAATMASGPGGEEVALDFGTLALEHGALQEAVRWLRIAIDQAPERAEAHEKLGLAFFLGGDPRNALPHLERACRLDPGSASAHLNLAATYAQLGRFPEAREFADTARRLDPSEPRTAELLKALPR